MGGGNKTLTQCILNQQAGQQPLVHTYGVNHPPPGGDNVVVNATFAPTAAGSTQITHYFLRTRQTGFGATGNAANGWRASDQGNGWSGFHLIFYSQTGNVAAPPSTLLGTYTITVTGTGNNSGQTVRISGQVITTPNNRTKTKPVRNSLSYLFSRLSNNSGQYYCNSSNWVGYRAVEQP
jgi:hypothetical protein